MKNNLSVNYINILNLMAGRNRFHLFHQEINELLVCNDSLEKQNHTTSGRKALKPFFPDQNEYLIFSDNKIHFVPLTSNAWTHFSHIEGFNKLITKKTLLENTISTIIKEMQASSNSKYVNLFKGILAYPGSTQFIHNIIYQKITNFNQSDSKIKLTGLCYDFSQALINFIIHHTFLNKIYLIFDHKQSLNLKTKDLDLMFNMVVALFTSETYQDSQMDSLFKECRITNSFLQEHVYDNLKYMFLRYYFRNRIYCDKIKTFIKQNVIEVKGNIDLFNKLNKTHVTLGYYFIDLLIEKGIFTSSPSTTKKNATIILTPTEQVVQDCLINNTIDKAFLNEKDFNYYDKKDLDFKSFELVHDNHRIDLALTAESYLHTNNLLTKFSIDIDYLTYFLTRIYKNDFTQYDYLALYHVNSSQIDMLNNFQISPFPVLLEKIFTYVNNFEQTITSNQLNKIIKVETIVILEALSQERERRRITGVDFETFEEHYNTSKQIYNQYGYMIETIINKICHRRNQIITLLKQAIFYSRFKYFIYPTYIDSRGRAYLSAVATNIFTSSMAKCFVKLHDENYGQSPSLEVLKIIRHTCDFVQTKSHVKSLMEKRNHDKTHIVEIYQYICSYLTVNIEQLDRIICDKSLDDTSLFDVVCGITKKPKKVFYVHSLIYYERLRKNNLHNKNIVNYIQKDASSSGLQMMSIFFKNAELAKISNLSGIENYDIYEKAASHCLQIYNQMKEFVNEALVWFDCPDILSHKQELVLTLKSYNSDDYDNISESKYYSDILIYLLTIDAESSSCTRQFINFIKDIIIENKPRNNIIYKPINNWTQCEFLVPYLPFPHLQLIRDFTKFECFKDQEKVLDYIFCLKYALRQIIISEQYIIKERKDWATRDLTKHHVMTSLYMSTAFGRRESYIKLLQDNYVLSKYAGNVIKEFASFLEKATSNYLSSIKSLSLLQQFLDTICKNEKIIITNRNFKITFNPLVTTDAQVSCSSLLNKRAHQLIIKKTTDKFDADRLKSMFMANLAHSMDSDVMHTFTEICLLINNQLKENRISFRLIFERNHDCFILNSGPLLKILLEEAYLKISKQNNINYIVGLDENTKKEFTSMNTHEFMKMLTPINPNFVK